MSVLTIPEIKAHLNIPCDYMCDDELLASERESAEAYVTTFLDLEDEDEATITVIATGLTEGAKPAPNNAAKTISAFRDRPAAPKAPAEEKERKPEPPVNSGSYVRRPSVPTSTVATREINVPGFLKK